jgi:hypothetical protein
VIRRVLTGAALVLALFHVWLFAGQAIEGQLGDPALLLRWLAAALLTAGLIALRRAGAPLLRGRKAVAIWLLAALLHGPAIGQRLATLEKPAIPEIAATLAQTAMAALVTLGTLLLLFAFGRVRVTQAGAFDLLAPQRGMVGALPPDAHLPFAPRPPPSV